METARTLSDRAKRLYAGTGLPIGALQVLRPYICPFEEIIPLVPAGARVLDAGCGAGLFLGLLADSGRIQAGTGFDSSRAALSAARFMMGKLSSGVPLDISYRDATSSWPEDRYDVVSLIDVLHHVPPPSQEAVIDRACKSVRPGGLLLYKDMATRPRWKALCNQAHDLLIARQWIHHVLISKVEEWAAARGFSKIAEGAASRYWYAHEWRVFRQGDSA